MSTLPIVSGSAFGSGAPPLASEVRLEVLRGREQAAPFYADVDVVVVGSGSGGATVARALAREGRSVLVVEEGGYYTPQEYGQFSPSNTFRRMGREAGLAVAVGKGDTPLISLLAGKSVGGSSILTGGVSFRIPEEVLEDWSTRLGLEGFAPDVLAPYFERIEEAVHVETVPEVMRSRSTALFVEGADKVGITMKSMRRNTRGCRGAARCNFGCPHGAKMSVDISMLPQASKNGARILSDALVERIDITSGAARGIKGRFLDETGEPRVKFEIRAKVVVVACGSLHTPLLLQKSGLSSVHVGRHLTLHPAIRVGALFDEEVNGWDGALQSVYSDQFHHDEGIWLNGVYTAVNVLAAAFPGIGREHRRLVKQIPHLAFFGGMVHDEGGGHVRRWISREPMITYEMVKRDKARLLKSIHILGRIAFAAGAREVLAPIFGMPTIKKESELDFLLEDKIPASKVECMSFHPLGSARMSTTREAGVVKPTGETWDVDNLFVIDGSVLPTSIGVNSQIPVMTVALKMAEGLAEDFGKHARRARS